MQLENKINDKGFDATIDKKQSIKLGVVLGLISLALGIIVLYVTRSIHSFLLLTSLSFVINTILYAVISAFFSFNLRKRNGGFWNFTIALKSIFLMLLISTLIATIGTLVFVNFVNPTLQEDVLRNTINVTIEFMEEQGAPDEAIDSGVAKLEEQVEKIGNISFLQALRGLGIAILVQFVFALVLSAITRNEKLFRNDVN